MSEQSAIAAFGDTLFGRGPQAALQAMSKAYELAFMKSLSQLSSPGADERADRTGHIGVCREIASYKVSRALAQTLAARAAATSDARAQEVLTALSREFAEFGEAAGQRILQASAFADATTTVEEALGEMFQSSPDDVASLLNPTPGVEWSTHEIAVTIQDLLAQGAAPRSILTAVRGQGIWVPAQSMTDLSLGLEADMRGENAPSWHAIAAKAGGAALLLDALFNNGYVAAKQLNTSTAFYEDGGLLGMVSELLSSTRVDFSVVQDYLPPEQALAWLVHAIDAGFTTDELNELMDATTVSSDGVAAVQKVLAQLRAVLVPGGAALPPSDGVAYYNAVFGTIELVQTTYGDTLSLESLVTQNASLITARAATDTDAGTAYRYALVELNAFALVGADYAPLNANGELDLYEASTGRGTLTLQYLADRPELLTAMIAANTSESAADASGVTRLDALAATFIDRDTGLTLTSTAPVAGMVLFDGGADALLTGGAGADRLYGEEGNDWLDGGDGDDSLDGGEGNDTLFGGAGQDLLRGGAGDDELVSGGGGDLLEGGAGFDSYRVRKGDVVRDGDGRGTVVFEGTAPGSGGSTLTQVEGGVQVEGSSLFRSEDGKVMFRENDDGSLDLWVEGERITVRPGEEESAPRGRRSDGSTADDLGGDGFNSGKPMLGMPMRKLNGPAAPSYKLPFDEAQAVPAPRRDRWAGPRCRAASRRSASARSPT